LEQTIFWRPLTGIQAKARILSRGQGDGCGIVFHRGICTDGAHINIPAVDSFGNIEASKSASLFIDSPEKAQIFQLFLIKAQNFL
jgi:hypothetical protein